MTTKTTPQDAYIDAAIAALTEAGLEPTESWADDGETQGMYCYLSAVITLDPGGWIRSEAEAPKDADWPNGLLLMWEWHVGVEEGEPERGPSWTFAELLGESRNEEPIHLPVYGYASPEAVVEAVRKVVAREITDAGPFGLIGESWDRADELDAACEAWGVKEANS